MENSEIKRRVLAVFAVVSLLLATGGVAGRDRGPPTNRIIGGDEASPGEFPFMAALDSSKSLCGCSIIDKRHVLTAAHCVTSNITNKPFDPRSLKVKVGCHSRTECSATYKVNRVMVHHAWESILFWLGNDIAVLELVEEIEFNSLSGPGAIDSIDLAPSEDSCCDTGAETLTATGWGLTDPRDKFYQGPLMKAELDSLSLEKCRASNPIPTDSNKFICTKTSGKGTCNGDSGGPLMRISPYARPIQVGIVSFGDRGCDTRNSTVFTKVSPFRGWIEQCTNNGTCPTL